MGHKYLYIWVNKNCFTANWSREKDHQLDTGLHMHNCTAAIKVTCCFLQHANILLIGPLLGERGHHFECWGLVLLVSRSVTMAEQLFLAEKCPPTPQGPLMLQLEQALFPLDADAWCTATAPAPVIHQTQSIKLLAQRLQI